MIYQTKAVDKYTLSHASNPLAVYLYDDVFRVFFSGRDKENKSSVSFVDIDIVKRKKVAAAKQALLTYGSKDSFYSHGISIGNTYSVDNKLYMLFMGWQVKGGKHWRGDIGRIQINESFKMTVEPSEAFMSSDQEDPVSLSYPWVLYDEGIYKMWYGSTVDWYSENDEMVHVIKYATSNDGEVWQKHGLAIPYEIGVAQAFSRPTVIKNSIGYHMWFSYRSGDGTPYRIGYAHSGDGLSWDRKNKDVGIDVSKEGWDSEMICYPFVFEHKGKLYMLYNGNNYGSEGFGLAIGYADI